ncbi:MAG: elongation factor G [Bacteroidales bacterium]|nr:elongation factor G [Bacteroidales bacterium]MBN2818395.1 elongation factor G [Bacteroidales bacterium]
MKTYNTEEIKNIVLVGNTGSGKTTLAESMLFEGKVIDRRGDVGSKNTVSDYKEIEHNNENSVFSSVLYTEYNNKKINIIDAPGLDDFVGGVISSMYAADTAVMLLNTQNGVEVGTEVQARHLAHFNKPVIIVANQLDHEKSNFEKTIETAKERISKNVTIVQYPVTTGPDFKAVIDVLLMKMYVLKENGGRDTVEIPAEEADRAAELHNELVEKCAENDEKLMEIFFDKGALTEDEMRKGITLGLLARDIFPVFCVSAKKDMGVGRLLEFISNVAPSPNQVPFAKDKEGKEIECNAGGQTSLFVFKSSNEQHIGDIAYFKVMSGKVTEGMDLTNSKTKNKERISQIFANAGKNRQKVPTMVAGDIGATVKLKATKFNQTLSADGTVFGPMIFPEPKHRAAIKPLAEGDEEKLGEALNRLHDEDPTIQVEYSKELKQIILSGQGEYHFSILKWHLDNIYKIETEFVKPRIPYRETITKPSQADYRHKKQSGGAGQFGEVHMIIEPYIEGAKPKDMFKMDGKEQKMSVRGEEEVKLSWGGKLMFYNCIVGGSIDARFLPAILKGIMEKMEEGPLTGSYARDICVYVYDGKMHPVDSNEISFKLAGRNAFSQAFKKADPKILEPIYNVEVFVPADRMGDVMSDLQGRRAIVQGMSSENGFEKITAKVPLAEMDKYQTSLSSNTGGRAYYSMTFDEYGAVPGDVQEALLKAYEAEQDDE